MVVAGYDVQALHDNGLGVDDCSLDMSWLENEEWWRNLKQQHEAQQQEVQQYKYPVVPGQDSTPQVPLSLFCSPFAKVLQFASIGFLQ